LANNDRNLERCLFLRAFQVRLCMLFAMAVINAIVPTLNDPGDDVVRFNLRAGDVCYNLKGSFCDCRWSCSWSETDLLDCAKTTSSSSTHNFLHNQLYPFLLAPLTRWDAARFLRLAHLPQLRVPNYDAVDDPFRESEQAHAFLDMFPAFIRVATIIIEKLPAAVVPSTCEQSLALAAWLINTASFCISTVVLFRLTCTLLRQDGGGGKGKSTFKYIKVFATRVSVLFTINPANVFFGTAYSESLFCTFVFCGCLAFSLDNVWVAVIAYIFATWTRSNGCLYFGLILLFEMGQAIRLRSVFGLTRAICCTLVLFAVTMGRYNVQAFRLHCEQDDPLTVIPSWCTVPGARYNVYSLIQRKHWNVGLFRYYVLKQIPNFCLAAPVLVLSSLACVAWIQNSFIAYRKTVKHEDWQGLVSFVRICIGWGFNALRLFESGRDNSHICHMNIHDVLIHSPKTLGYFAVLTAATLLCVFVAHIQISTRLIFSLSPAIYWYMTSLVLSSPITGTLVLGYCLLFTFLGIVLHSTWLPWT
jgi:phosphatidylinositol glycan class V